MAFLIHGCVPISVFFLNIDINPNCFLVCWLYSILVVGKHIKDEIIKEQDFVYAPNYLNEYIYFYFGCSDVLMWLLNLAHSSSLSCYFP